MIYTWVFEYLDARTVLCRSCCFSPRSTESQALQPQETKASTGLYPPVHLLCVRDFMCVCVCVRERERERERLININLIGRDVFLWFYICRED
jgi:hypothetical protein